jgi:hypothetical protein
MIHYAVDTEHMVITAKPTKNLEEKAIAKMQVKVVGEKQAHYLTSYEKYIIFKIIIRLWLQIKTPPLL